MMACPFCAIVAGEAPAEVVYRDELVTAFRDNRPAAKTHLLIIPNKHIGSVNELEKEEEAAAGRLFIVARQLAQDAGIQQDGFRLIINTGPDANQTVPHLHMHLMGGGPMRYPIG
jgi:histidine triad (HIT) family protein